MIAPQGGLAALLAGQNNYLTADCYQFTPVSGPVLKITGYPTDLAGFTAAGFAIEHGNHRSVLGLENPTVTLTVHCDARLNAAAGQLLSDAAGGVYDGAAFVWTRYYMATPGDTSSYCYPFAGTVEECRASTTKVMFQVGTPLGLVDSTNIGRPFQAQCPWVFRSAPCGYSGSTTSCDGTVAACQAMAGGSNLANYGGFPSALAPNVNLQSI